MWKKIAPLLILLSVTLNLAVAGSWALQAIRGYRSAPARFDPPEGGEAVWCPLHRRLNVTDEQWQRIEPRMVQFRVDSQALCGEMQRLRRELIDLLGADQPDLEALSTKREAILAGQRRMQQLVISHLLAEKEVLTAEQREELFELLRSRNDCPGHAMMDMSGIETDRPKDSERRSAKPVQGEGSRRP